MLPWRSPARVIRISKLCHYGMRPKSSTANAAQSLSLPSSTATVALKGSAHHDDLASFLKHARLRGLSDKSTVYIGTHYEYSVIEVLKHFGFNLTRTGRSSDLGIDLVGQWTVPSLPVPIRTIIQCKARSKKLSPENVRELEGAFTGAPTGWRGEGVLGFLVAAEAATKGVRDAMIRSSLPLGFMQISRKGIARQLLWNRVAAEGGLEGMGVTLQHGRPKHQDNGALSEGDEVVLTWQGKAVMNELLGSKAKRKKIGTE